MNNKSVIGFSGRAHNGKTMLSEYLVREWGYERFSVAHALKRICANLLGFPSINEMNEHKTEQKKYVLRDVDIKFLSNESGVPFDFIKEELIKINNTLTSVRHALQYIGTEIFRKYDPDWHVKQLVKEIEESESDKIVIDDIRFANEHEIMRQMDAKLIFIVRPMVENVSHHRSDEELDWKMFGHKVIINNGDADFAIKQLNWLIKMGCNGAFKKALDGYNELDIRSLDAVADLENNQLKVYHFGKEIIYTMNDNPLIIEDLKRKLRYE